MTQPQNQQFCCQTSPRSPTLRELPQGWRWARLGDVCRLVNGKAYNESRWSSHGLPIIRIQNLNDRGKPFNYWRGGLDGHVAVGSGDVLLGWSGTPGTSFGAHIWDRGPGVLNQHIFRLDLDRSAVRPEWAVVAINHRLQTLIDKAHGGVGLRHVKRAEVEGLTIPLPTLPEQKRIASLLNVQMVAVDRARTASEAQLRAARSLPAAYLREVFGRVTAGRWPARPLSDLFDIKLGKMLSPASKTGRRPRP